MLLVLFGESDTAADGRMALLAVVERAGDRPGELPKTQVVPVGMPQDTAFRSYFGGAPTVACMAPRVSLLRSALAAPAALFSRIRARPQVAYEAAYAGPAEPAVYEEAVDALLELAAKIEPDGGMPGRDEEERVQATILALLAFLAERHTERSGIFRSHVQRLLAFLEGAVHVHPMVGRIVVLARQGRSLKGDWSDRQPGPHFWAELAAADPGELA